MIQRRHIFALPAGLALSAAHAFKATAQDNRDQSTQANVLWVAEALKRMLTIKPGMTRERLLTVFTIEGGISNRLGRRYVSRDCPYFKVDVEFKPAEGVDDRDADGRLIFSGDYERDVILKISQPYLQFSIFD